MAIQSKQYTLTPLAISIDYKKTPVCTSHNNIQYNK